VLAGAPAAPASTEHFYLNDDDDEPAPAVVSKTPPAKRPRLVVPPSGNVVHFDAVINASNKLINKSFILQSIRLVRMRYYRRHGVAKRNQSVCSDWP